jgi:hypothetical protein
VHGKVAAVRISPLNNIFYKVVRFKYTGIIGKKAKKEADKLYF